MEYSASDNNLVTISMDDTLRITPLGDEGCFLCFI